MLDYTAGCYRLRGPESADHRMRRFRQTDVVSRRIAELLLLPGVRLANIVAFTFAERAAAELKDRVLRRILDASGSALGSAEMFIGTTHAYCLDILQLHVPETFRYRVLTEVTNRLFIARHSRESGLATCPVMSARVAHLRPNQDAIHPSQVSMPAVVTKLVTEQPPSLVLLREGPPDCQPQTSHLAFA